MSAINSDVSREFSVSERGKLEAMSDKRTKCLVFTRAMGYHRPIESFNLGKQGEHAERVKFREPKDR
jgi:anaerobic ribonucleoside-triphosphate reductase